VRRIALCGFGLLDLCGESMNSLRFGTVLAVAMALGLLGQAIAQDAAGEAAVKDDSAKAEVQGEAGKAAAQDTAKKAGAPDEGGQEAAVICKNPQCPVIVGAWQKDIKACVTKNARLKELEGEVGTLQVKGKELAACADAREEAERRAKEATDRVDSLQKELEVLKQAAAAAGDPQKYLEAVERAMQWKEVAERVKDEADAAKKEVTDLKTKVASLEAKVADDPNRGMKNVDKTPETKTPPSDTKVDDVALSDLEQKNKKLQEILDDTRRVLVEKQKEMEVSDGAIHQVLTDLVDLLGKTFECASFSVEMKNGVRVLKGTVGEGRHRDEAWKMVLDSPLARLVHSSEIDVTAAGGRVCFVKTREPGWLMAKSRDKADQGATLFLRFALDPSVIQMLPQASDNAECETLGGVVKALEPLEPRPSELAVWVRGGNGAVTQCYAAPDGWKLRYRVPDRDGKWQAWILLREGNTGGGGVRP
jgi:hypothetical protein